MLLFSVSHTDTEGKIVDQSRYAVDTTVVNGLFWRTS
jgi:hypothetical protein